MIPIQEAIPKPNKIVVITPKTRIILRGVESALHKGLQGKSVSLRDIIRCDYKGKPIEYTVIGLIPPTSKSIVIDEETIIEVNSHIYTEKILEDHVFRAKTSVRFEVTENHLKLLRCLWVDWDKREFGAPRIDYKRPYGNREILQNMAEILQMPPVGEKNNFSPDQINFLLRYHAEMLLVLQIGIDTGSFQPGLYELIRDPAVWRFRRWERRDS